MTDDDDVMIMTDDQWDDVTFCTKELHPGDPQL
eukprot:CAMPEP_0185758266 /NCGR_PEP_ID=MMETSP1174-20130828/16882_1 /TAXON_ID=35687 /ORGANISM="Dictyocha speculum, Strain CCMP1381" /LENGTH=32 /DNA_ID= /DNA_START= /DNA_END= /DNA_ORIENTATION=